MAEFNTVGIVGRMEANDQIIETLNHLYRYLQQRQVDIILEHNASIAIAEVEDNTYSCDDLGKHCDLVIVVGGDGSMLTAARALAKHNVPVVGINRGGLGFLTDIAPDELESKLNQVFAQQYSTESRFLVQAELRQDGQVTEMGQALNDVVLSCGQSARMIEFELYINDCFVYSQRSNGLIVSTPTGSTAYALSGGGPIMHPSLDAIVLVPMFPHTLTGRPIVVDGNSEIKIIPGTLHDTSPQVSCDGQVNFVVAPGDELHIVKMAEPLTLIHPTEDDFYQRCRNKLDWGSRLGEYWRSSSDKR